MIYSGVPEKDSAGNIPYPAQSVTVMPTAVPHLQQYAAQFPGKQGLGLPCPVSGYTDVIGFRIIISADLAYVYLGTAAAHRR